MSMVIFMLSILLSTISVTDMMIYPGQVKIGVLFSIREAPDPSDPSQKCGPIREVHGIQKLEAALYIRELINARNDILPGVTLGMEVRDTCWSETLALRQSLCLIKGRHLTQNVHVTKKRNQNQTGDMVQSTMIIQNPSVIGVVGPASTEQTIPVQSLLKLLNIPQIGYSDTMPGLDDKKKYPTFLRVVPCDSHQAIVIRDILIKFKWSYVATVHTSGVFGESIFSYFRKSVEPECNDCGICIAKDHVVESHYNDSDFDDIIRDFNDYTSVNVIISFCEREVSRKLFEATKRLNLTNRFTFIISDGWGDADLMTQGLEEQAWGTIFVMIHSPAINEFSGYYTTLKPFQNTRNPWFREFWEKKFNCVLVSDDEKRDAMILNDILETTEIPVSSNFCTGNENLFPTYHEHRKVFFVMEAIKRMAEGLHNMLKETCGPESYVQCLENQPIDTSKFMDHLVKLSHMSGRQTILDLEESVPRYDILNFQNMSGQLFSLISIGKWINGTLHLYEIQDRPSRNLTSVTSICSQPCQMGYHKTFVRDNKNQACCWECKPCGEYEYVSFNKEQCIECPVDQKPNATLTGCDQIPIVEFHWFEPTTIMIVIFSITGLTGTFFTLYVFIKYKNTPIVRASNRDISFLILFSMILAHVSVFTILARPTPFSCTIARIIPAVALTMMYAGLFMETYRIARILVNLKKKFPKKKYRPISTPFQISVTFFCVAIEIAICSAMILANPSASMIIRPSRDRPTTTCARSDTDLIPVLGPIAFLHCLCIIYAFKTRNVTGNFNEAKFMGFAMLISSIIWVVFFTVYLGTSDKPLTMTMCLTLISSFTLIFLFFPKLYIIIFKPEKNNSALFTRNRRMRNIGSKLNVYNSESMVQHPINIMAQNNFELPEHRCRLRRSVAIQTSSKLLRNMLSSSEDDSDDDESFSDDNSFNLKHDDAKTFPDIDKHILTTISRTVEEKNFSNESTSPFPQNSSPLSTDKFSSELNVDNLQRPENNKKNIFSQNVDLDLKRSDNVLKKKTDANTRTTHASAL